MTVVGGGVVGNAFSELNYFGTARRASRLRCGPRAWVRQPVVLPGAPTKSASSVAAPAHSPPASASDTHVGWTAGGGVEWALVDNWTAKVEYLYLELGNETYLGGPAGTAASMST